MLVVRVFDDYRMNLMVDWVGCLEMRLCLLQEWIGWRRVNRIDLGNLVGCLGRLYGVVAV